MTKNEIELLELFRLLTEREQVKVISRLESIINDILLDERRQKMKLIVNKSFHD